MFRSLEDGELYQVAGGQDAEAIKTAESKINGLLDGLEGSIDEALDSIAASLTAPAH